MSDGQTRVPLSTPNAGLEKRRQELAEQVEQFTKAGGKIKRYPMEAHSSDSPMERRRKADLERARRRGAEAPKKAFARRGR